MNILSQARRRWWLAPLFAWVACNSALTHIDVNQSAKTTVGGASILEELVGSLGFSGFLDMNISDAQELQNQGVEPGDIKDMRLVTFDLHVTDPADGDLSFLSSMEVYVESDGLERQRIAWQDTFPEGERTVSFEIDDVDLTDYAVADSMSLVTEVDGHRPNNDTTVKATVLLDVGVTAKGACHQAKRNK